MTRSYIKCLVIATAVLLASACNSSSGSDQIVDPGTSTSTSSSSTSSAPTASTSSSTTRSTEKSQPGKDANVIDRYVAFWRVRFEANQDPPNPDDPRFHELATGRQLDNVIAETRERLEEGIAFRAAEPSKTSHDVRVVSRTDDRAELQDCFINDDVVYRIETGEILDDATVTRNVAAVMVRINGTWKLETASVLQQWEGIAGCAPAS